MELEEKKQCLDIHYPLSWSKQCQLLQLARSTAYYTQRQPSARDLLLMRRIDEISLERPYYGWRRIWACLREEGHLINTKKVRRLMQVMGIQAIYPKKNLSKNNLPHLKFPYLLRDKKIEHPLEVWSADITYIPMNMGFGYLVVIMDWFSRMVLAWRLSNSLDSIFCIEALEDALEWGTPVIFNTDQGIQFTSKAFVQAVVERGMQFSMDGKGRALDNVFIERLWRSLKYEEVYLREYTDFQEARKGIKKYFSYYNTERPHQSLGYVTPLKVHEKNLQR